MLCFYRTLTRCSLVSFSALLTVRKHNIGVELSTMESLKVRKCENGVQHYYYFNGFTSLLLNYEKFK